MFMDEATDALDDARAEAFIKMIPRLSKNFNQVFVISHDAMVLSSLPNKIVFSRSGPNEPTVVESFLWGNA
jgi:DNA repair exonuclease SbcCD ATPase subunit